MKMNYASILENKKLCSQLTEEITNYVSVNHVKEEPKLSFSEVSDFFHVSDIFVYRVAEQYDLLGAFKPTRKKIGLKYQIVDLVLNHPMEFAMKDLISKFEKTNVNQVISYLEEEGIRDYVPKKFGKIEHKVLKFVEEHSGEYSTQEVIDELGLNRKTFYKIYNGNPDSHVHFKTMSKNSVLIKELVDSKKQKLKLEDISEILGIRPIVVKNNLEKLGYLDKVIMPNKVSITKRITRLLEENPNQYQITEVSELVDANYNTVYKIIHRNNLTHLLA